MEENCTKSVELDLVIDFARGGRLGRREDVIRAETVLEVAGVHHPEKGQR